MLKQHFQDSRWKKNWGSENDWFTKANNLMKVYSEQFKNA